MATKPTTKKTSKVSKPAPANISRSKLKNFTFKRIHLLIVVGLLALLGFLLFRSYAGAEFISQGVYVDSVFADKPANGGNKLMAPFVVEDITPDGPLFFYTGFGFVGPKADGGYIGLQEHGNRPNTLAVGKTAVFSIFGATDGANPAGSCEIKKADFDGGPGGGSSCRTEYTFQKGRQYTSIVQPTRTDATGVWWGGWIQDNTTNVATLIAEIKVPLTWKGLKPSTGQTIENYGAPVAGCNLLAYARVKFSNPTIDGRTASSWRTSVSGPRTNMCSNSRSTSVQDGAVLEEGGNTGMPANANPGDKATQATPAPNPTQKDPNTAPASTVRPPAITPAPTVNPATKATPVPAPAATQAPVVATSNPATKTAATPAPAAPAPQPQCPEQTFGQGNQGGCVTLIQQRLVNLGYDPGAVDGIFGDKTFSAVKIFQNKSGITVDGVVGPNTWARLFDANAARKS